MKLASLVKLGRHQEASALADELLRREQKRREIEREGDPDAGLGPVVNKTLPNR